MSPHAKPSGYFAVLGPSQAALDDPALLFDEYTGELPPVERRKLRRQTDWTGALVRVTDAGPLENPFFHHADVRVYPCSLMRVKFVIMRVPPYYRFLVKTDRCPDCGTAAYVRTSVDRLEYLAHPVGDKPFTLHLGDGHIGPIRRKIAEDSEQLRSMEGLEQNSPFGARDEESERRAWRAARIRLPYPYPRETAGNPPDIKPLPAGTMLLAMWLLEDDEIAVLDPPCATCGVQIRDIVPKVDAEYLGHWPAARRNDSTPGSGGWASGFWVKNHGSGFMT